MADSQHNINTSRRRFLASAPAAALLAGSVALPDPIFAAIHEHRRLVDDANERGTSDEEAYRRSSAECEYLRDVLLDVEPTTLAGACALLIYIVDDAEPFKDSDHPTAIAAQTARDCLAKLNVAI